MTSYTPQSLLDHLHQLEIPSLFSPHIAADEKKKSVKITKQKLKLLKKQVKQEIEVIKAKWDGRNRYEAQQERLHLAPYTLLETLISQVEVSLNELEIRGSVDWKPEFGSVIVGDFNSGEWHIFSPPDALRWQAQSVKKHIGRFEDLIAQDEKLILELGQKAKDKMDKDRKSAIIYALIAPLTILGAVPLLRISVPGALMLIAVGIILFGYASGLFTSSRKSDQHIVTQINKVKEHIIICREGIVNSKRLLNDLNFHTKK